MLASEAKSAATASPRPRTSASRRRIRLDKIPRRRYEGSTLTAVTPAIVAAPPGTVMRKVTAPAVPTMSEPSNAARLRSNSKTVSSCCSSGSVGYVPLKACSITAKNAGNSLSLIGRIG